MSAADRSGGPVARFDLCERAEMLRECPAPSVLYDGETFEIIASSTVADELYAGGESLYGRDVRELYHPDERAAVVGGLSAAPHPCRHVNAAGEAFWAEVVIRSVACHGEGACLMLVFDISRHVENEERLRVSEDRYATAIAGANDGIWDWDLSAQHIFFSDRWKELLGYGPAEIDAEPEEWFSRIHPDDVASVRAEIDLHLRGLTPHLQTEYRMRSKTGEMAWMLTRGLARRDAEGRAVRLAGSQTDVTERKRTEEILLHGALYDPLTSLANRALLLERLSFLAARMRTNPERRFSVLFLDLDRFKQANDDFGHAAGDEVLTMIGARLRSVMPPEDMVARMGSDEFAVVLDAVDDPKSLIHLAERVIEQVRLPIRVGDKDVRLTASAGVAVSGPRAQRGEDVLRDAESAMHRVKTRGGNAFDIFDERVYGETVAVLRTETELRQALEVDEFELAYQPIVSIADGELIGAEALLRWRHPVEGHVLPSRFISIAEDSGLIVPIGAWALREACRDLATWTELGHRELGVSVNLSLKQFRSDIVSLVRSVLEETGVPGARLTLEITESIAMDEPERTLEVLGELRALGVGIAMDDFGTGYSSLGYLKRFRFDEVKIDRTFINDIDTDAEAAALVAAIVGLAHAFRSRCVAEGIETPDQFSYLRLLNCDYAQGYLLSHPLPADEFRALLADGPAPWLGKRF